MYLRLRKGDVFMSNFIHLHVHSEYSNIRLLDSTNKFEEMILYVANTLGQRGLALTDHDTLSGHVRFLATVKELKSKGKINEDFKPILGNEIYLMDETVETSMAENNHTSFPHFILLATNSKGHHMLRQLSTRAWKRSRVFRGIERVNTYYSDIEAVIGNDKGCLIGSTACLGSYFARQVLAIINAENETQVQEAKDNIYQFICWCLDTFGEDNFFIELQPSKLDNYEQVEYNKLAVKIANAYQIPYIVTTDAHYLNKEQAGVHEAFLTSQDDTSGSREVGRFYESTYFHSEEELYQSLGYLGEDVVKAAIDNTKRIADRCEEYSLEKPQTIPVIPLPDESEWYKNPAFEQIAMKYENLRKMMTSESQYDRYLISLCFEGLVERQIPNPKIETYLKRIDLECEEIIGVTEVRKEPISSYFITMKKIVDIIWQVGSIVGTGRGSAGCFLINYLLGIVQMNPLEIGVELSHWRFLHKSKVEIPKNIGV